MHLQCYDTLQVWIATKEMQKEYCYIPQIGRTHCDIGDTVEVVRRDIMRPECVPSGRVPWRYP